MAIVAGALLAAAFATALFQSSNQPIVAGYRSLPIQSLVDDGYLSALDGQKIWITGGAICFEDQLVPIFSGDWPMSEISVRLNPLPNSSVKIPPWRDDFGPFGILRVANEKSGSATLTLDVQGERDWHHAAQWRSPQSDAIALAALTSLIAAIAIAFFQAVPGKRTHRLHPG